MVFQRLSLSFVALFVGSMLCAATVSGGGQETKSTQAASRPRVASETQKESNPTLKHADRRDESNEQTEVVTIETDRANVLLTAVDRNRRFITTIQKEDIRVL